jgi:hypothetical protein
MSGMRMSLKKKGCDVHTLQFETWPTNICMKVVVNAECYYLDQLLLLLHIPLVQNSHYWQA